jgi:hypothetical protein
MIKALFEANNEEYGYRRLHQALVRSGEQAGPELVPDPGALGDTYPFKIMGRLR